MFLADKELVDWRRMSLDRITLMSCDLNRVLPPPRKSLVVGVADMAVSNDTSADLITYSLGSCLGITLYDPKAKVGGLLHVMLSDSSIDIAKSVRSPCMFVDTGVPRLFDSVCNLGADRRLLIIKVAGGAQLLDPCGVFSIGDRNYRALSSLLSKYGYLIHASDVGGFASRTLRLDLATGIVSIKSPGTPLRYL